MRKSSRMISMLLTLMMVMSWIIPGAFAEAPEAELAAIAEAQVGAAAQAAAEAAAQAAAEAASQAAETAVQTAAEQAAQIAAQQAAARAAAEAAEKAAAEAAAQVAAQAAAEAAAVQAAASAAAQSTADAVAQAAAMAAAQAAAKEAALEASFWITLKNEEEIYEGDFAILEATVESASREYTPVWQQMYYPTEEEIEKGMWPEWKDIYTGSSMVIYMVSGIEENEYRLTLVADNGEILATDSFHLPVPAVKPSTEPEPVDSEQDPEVPAEDPEVPAEEPVVPADETTDNEETPSDEEVTEPQAPAGEEVPAVEELPSEEEAPAGEEPADEPAEEEVTDDITEEIEQAQTEIEEILAEEIPAEEPTEEAEIETEESAEESKPEKEEKAAAEILIDEYETPLGAVAFTYTYERDENGELVLDENGNPIAILEEGQEIPMTWLRDEEGNLILDANGNPVATQTIPANAEYVQTLYDLLDPNRYIDVYVTFNDQEAVVGSTATLVAVLNGYDNLIYELQWQQSDDGSTWHDLEGGNQTRVDVVTSVDNMHDFWRMQVTITGVQDQI